MELTEVQEVLHQIINGAWENESFKKELMTNPLLAIEELTGEKLELPDGKELVVRDQSYENTIYINLPAKETSSVDEELNEVQLQTFVKSRILVSNALYKENVSH